MSPAAPLWPARLAGSTWTVSGRRMGRSLVLAVTVASVTACAIGVPFPRPTFKKNSGERYPCENHPCGCTDAENCWRDCCCMSHSAKLAWAKKAGVTPPDYVVAAARETRTKSDEGRPGLSAQCCCGHKSRSNAIDKAPCCGGKRTSAPTNCGQIAACCSQRKLVRQQASCKAGSPTRCQSKSCWHQKRGSPHDGSAPCEPEGYAFTVLHAAMNCHGLSMTAALLPPALPVLCAEFAPHVLARLEPQSGDSPLYDAPFLSIDAPPPRAWLA